MNKQEKEYYISNLVRVDDRTLAKLGNLAINAELNDYETRVVFLEITERFINQVTNQNQ